MARQIANAENKIASAAPELDGKEERKSEVRTSFSGFPKLPLELRIMIWQFARPSRRYVEIKHTTLSQPSRRGDTKPPTWHPICVDPEPALLFICHEARREITNKYRPLKGTTPGCGIVWVDLREDVLIFLRSDFYSYGIASFVSQIPEEMRGLVTCIAAEDSLICTGSLPVDATTELPFLDNLTRFSALKELTVLHFVDRNARTWQPITGIVPSMHVFLCIRKERVDENIKVVKARNPQWKEPSVETG